MSGCRLAESKGTESSESENGKSRSKTMLTASVYANGTLQHNFVVKKQTVNAKFYKEVI
jgi:hypothetical protein